MEIGEFEVLPMVEEVSVICGVHGSNPRRMWRHLLKVKEMGFSGASLQERMGVEAFLTELTQQGSNGKYCL